MSNKIQVVMTAEEIAELEKEAKLQQRPTSNLARKYINEGIKKDKKLRNELPPHL